MITDSKFGKDYETTGTDCKIYSFPTKSITGEDFGEYHDIYEDINKEALSKSNLEEGMIMDNNEILSKYMDKVDQDRRDSDNRNEKRISSLEEKMDNRLNRIEDNIKFYTESVSQNITHLDSKMDTKISGLENKLDNKLTLLEGKIDNNNKWIIGISISTILAIAAMIISVLVSK